MYAAGFVVLALGLSLAACGGGSGSTAAGHGPMLSAGELSAIGSADLAVFAAANATGNIVEHPANVRQAEQLLKPLIETSALQVNASSAVVGGLVGNLIDQLDNVVPGLTVGAGAQEHLNNAVVHRLYVFGLKAPVQVFRPTAARGVSELVRLLHGVAPDTQVSAPGVAPVQTARQLVTDDEQTARRYWPDLGSQLAALNSSLH